MLHFAYGSNMHLPMMRRRCPGARPLGRATLTGHRFMVMRDGYATIAPAPGHAVHGVLWRLTVRDLAVLHAYENLAGGLYRAVTLPVAIDRRHRPALVYVGRSRSPGRPRPGYLALVMEAARAAGLPPRYVRGLARFQAKPVRGRARRS